MAYLSGSMVVDRNNTAGFGANAQVAVYTLLDKTTKRQAQGISFSTDGRHFQFFPGNPVLDIGSTEFRDPSVFWHAPSAQWIMAVALAREKTVRFYSSPDLKHWTWMSDFTVPGASQGAWECPDLFELPVDGDPARKKWVLVVSVDWDHEEYFVGDFDGRRFKLADEGADGSPAAAAARYVDRGLDFYASRTFRDYDATLKHTISVGWVASWLYATKVPSSWGKGFWSIPRDLALQTYPDGVRLLQSPVEQLKRLRGAAVARAVPLDAGTTVLSTFKPERNVYEIDATFDTDFPNLFGLDLCVGSGRKVGLRYDSRTHVLTIDRSNSAELPIPGFARQASATVAPVDHRLRLHIYVDKSSMEVFANEGREVFTLLTYAADTQTQIDTFAEQRGTVMDFKAWKLDSIWRKPSKAGGSAARARGAALRVTPGMR
jgi:fructan beta-fructosidase